MDSLRTSLSLLRKADTDYSLIDNGDKIVVGLSGGKDSLCLLRLLSIYGKYVKKDFSILPVFIDLGFSWNRSLLTPLKEYCGKLGFSLYIEDSSFVFDILKANSKEGKHLPCSICSRMKKASICKVAKEKGYNKVAFAHHSNDALETLFMNMIHGGRVATFEPKMPLERAGVTFIRPLIYCFEKDLINLAKEENMPITDTCCPANKKTEREETKKLLENIYQKYPEANENFHLMLHNEKPFYLYWKSYEFATKEDPSIAIKPIISADDIRGTKLANLKKKESEIDYLILKKGKRIGEFRTLRPYPHQLIVFSLRGAVKELTLGIKELLRREIQKVNPLKIEIRGNKKVAIELGLKEEKLRTYNGTFNHFK